MIQAFGFQMISYCSMHFVYPNTLVKSRLFTLLIADPVEIEAVVPRGPEQHLLTVRDGGRWDAVRFNRALEALALQPQVGVLFVAPGLYHGRSEGFELEREREYNYFLLSVFGGLCGWY